MISIIGIYYPNNNSISLTIQNNCNWILSNPEITIDDELEAWKKTWILQNSYDLTDISTCCSLKTIKLMKKSRSISALLMNSTNDSLCSSFSNNNNSIKIVDNNSFLLTISDYRGYGISHGFADLRTNIINFQLESCQYIFVSPFEAR